MDEPPFGESGGGGDGDEKAETEVGRVSKADRASDRDRELDPEGSGCPVATIVTALLPVALELDRAQSQDRTAMFPVERFDVERFWDLRPALAKPPDLLQEHLVGEGTLVVQAKK
jgi:hypothetical protein